MQNKKDVDHPIVLFDGVCNVCNGAVQWIIRHDQQGRFHFASLQSDVAANLYGDNPSKTTSPDSIILLEDGRTYMESTAVLRICKGLDGWWKGLYIFIVVPRFIRDGVYRWFARNRYRWFGKQETCMIPTPEIRSRFVDQGE
ncbi:Predicted thiol-disulfide oxidoreductase YuxK, DCC family [Marininema mesophilum]|uniref:Predicted thiol-disulfide oxidoreductase YuxK, DCC family n=1 Tax=Marininema mesophilum TaxID=1048340 RepID=A0A1H2YD97_9BACL|nr:thiol-disulfide oxidoreductase DCC family protein [Marininema mesophilum]SDX03040.1 Predicted thiol-disulfide oxidoreductase YuxK, DCC family [Marininema mesophilum]